jgi:hypothetical protein
MSLIWRRRAIARAVAGDLSPAAEVSLRAHLRGCQPCRRHYDALSLVATAAAPSAGAGRERARLMAALGQKAAPPKPRSWRVPLVLVPTAAAAALVIVLARPRVEQPENVSWRGDDHAAADDARARAARASLSLRLYARRKAPSSPVRLVGEVPGSGELHVSAQDELQLAYAGLTEPRHLVVVAVDEAGRVQRYYPRSNEAAPLSPTREPRLLGPPLALNTRGRLRLVGVVSKAPLDPAAVTSGKLPKRDTAFEAVLWIDP